MIEQYDDKREWMVTTQLIKRGIHDSRVLEIMRKVPRHKFVEKILREQAYEDHPLPIDCGQTISQPYMVALMTQLLKLTGNEKVLEIGTGSGYQSAILGELAQQVYTVEKVPELSIHAQNILTELNYTNVIVVVGDGTLGFPQFAPYDRIIVTAAAPFIPQPLLDQLADIDGILVIPEGNRFFQTLTIVQKKGKELIKTCCSGCVFVPLIGKYGWAD